MAALTSREAARERLRKLFEERLETFIPQEASVPLQGSTFDIFETQAEECGLPLLSAMMEERCKLDGQACVEEPGRCPYCRSNRVYLRAERPAEERQSNAGRNACDSAWRPSAMANWPTSNANTGLRRRPIRPNCW